MKTTPLLLPDLHTKAALQPYSVLQQTHLPSLRLRSALPAPAPLSRTLRPREERRSSAAARAQRSARGPARAGRVRARGRADNGARGRPLLPARPDPERTAFGYRRPRDGPPAQQPGPADGAAFPPGSAG